MGRGRGRERPKKRPPVAAESEDEAGEVEDALALPVGAEVEDALALPVGAEVEVRDVDDPGFVSSFYEAIVTGHLTSSKGRGLYAVVYSTLEADQGEPLRETAAAADVRPRPPPEDDGGTARREFVMYEMVEAFHNEGWWAGVVFAVPPLPVARHRGPRVYKVAFPTSRELLEFEETALRPHRVFEGGRWVPAAEVDNGNPLFREGNQVEVSRSGKLFGESWNPATVFKVIGATNFLVQYRYIGEDGELATEILDVQYIRPARTTTRMDSKYRFSPSSHVEVFHEGSWWPGVILEVIGSEIMKKYAVKLKSHETDMDDVECVEVLTVENTQLRPRFDWSNERKWVHYSTEKPDNRFQLAHKKNNGSQLTSRKRRMSASLALYNDGNEIRDKPGSCLDKKSKITDVPESISPFLSVCNSNYKTKHKSNSYPEETMKQKKAVLALGSQFASPSLPSVAGFGHLSDSSLARSSHIEQSFSQMISIPSVQQHGQLQSSLFGAFGQPRQLPHGPFLRMQSLSHDYGSIGGSKELLTGQKKKSTDEGCYLMASADQMNIHVRSFVGTGTDLSRKREELVSFQTPGALGGNLEILKKGIASKIIEEANNTVANYECLAKPTYGDDDVETPNDTTHVSGIHPEINTVSCNDPSSLQDVKGSQEKSGMDDLQQGSYVGEIGHGSTKDNPMIENSMLSITLTTLGNPSDVNMFSTESTVQYGNKITKFDMCAVSAEQNGGEEFCQGSLVLADSAEVHSLPSVKSCLGTMHEDQLFHDDMGATVECVRTETSTMSQTLLHGTVPNLLPPDGNFDVIKNVDIDMENHRGNLVGLPSNEPETQHASVDCLLPATSYAALKRDIVMTGSSNKKFADNEQHAISRQDHSSAMIGFAVEGSQSAEKSAISQLSSVGMSNSTAIEPDTSLTLTKGVEVIPICKYVASKTQDSCFTFSPESLPAHESIVDERLSESSAIQPLPFVKTSPIWTQIEAMEIFNKVPQQPNFHQFQEQGPELREGMSLGLMFSFANLAESINRLNVGDANELFEEKMKSLSVLEVNGFDVRLLQSRLETLLQIKETGAKVHDTVKRLEEKIAHRETDDRLLSTKIRMLSTAVHHLELNSYLLRSIMRSAISQKISNATEISALKTEVSEVERSYQSLAAPFSPL